MAIEVVSAIILAPNVFGPIHSFAARGVENLAENAPPKKIVYNFVIYQNKAAKFGTVM